MSQLKLTADSGGGTVAIKAPASTTGNSAFELTLPGTGNRGLGKILQVIHATTSSPASSTTASFIDSNLTATITPSSTSSKVLVIISQSFRIANGTAAGGGIQTLRNSTVIQAASPSDSVGPAQYYIGNFGASSNFYTRHNTHILDSPSTTSATTYKTQFRLYSVGTGRVMDANPGLASDDGDSYITLMEVAA